MLAINYPGRHFIALLGIIEGDIAVEAGKEADLADNSSVNQRVHACLCRQRERRENGFKWIDRGKSENSAARANSSIEGGQKGVASSWKGGGVVNGAGVLRWRQWQWRYSECQL